MTPKDPWEDYASWEVLGNPAFNKASKNALAVGSSSYKKFSGSSSQSDKAVSRRGAHRAGLISTHEDDEA